MPFTDIRVCSQAGESFTNALDWYVLSFQQTLSVGVVKFGRVVYCFYYSTSVHCTRKFHSMR